MTFESHFQLKPFDDSMISPCPQLRFQGRVSSPAGTSRGPWRGYRLSPQCRQMAILDQAVRGHARSGGRKLGPEAACAAGRQPLQTGPGGRAPCACGGAESQQLPGVRGRWRECGFVAAKIGTLLRLAGSRSAQETARFASCWAGSSGILTVTAGASPVLAPFRVLVRGKPPPHFLNSVKGNAALLLLSTLSPVYTAVELMRMREVFLAVHL